MGRVLILQKGHLEFSLVLDLEFQADCLRNTISYLSHVNIFSLISVVDNLGYFHTNFVVHGTHTRHNTQLNMPILNLSGLPSCISYLRNDKINFKAAIQRYLILHSFYSLEPQAHRKDINYNMSFIIYDKCMKLFDMMKQTNAYNI